MAMNSVDGQDTDRNTFRKVFSNVLPFPKGMGQLILDGAFATSIATLHSDPPLNPANRCNHAVRCPFLVTAYYNVAQPVALLMSA